MRDVDQIIRQLLDNGRLRADTEAGHVYSPRSNTPDKPIGTLTKKGYLRACVTVDGVAVHIMIHRVIWIAAHGLPAPGTQIDHGGAGKAVNQISNLDGVSNAENMRRATVDGKFAHVGRRDGIRDDKGRFGHKRCAGRLLDGIEHNGYPRGR